MFCNKCGFENRDKAKICVSCKSNITDVPSVDAGTGALDNVLTVTGETKHIIDRPTMEKHDTFIIKQSKIVDKDSDRLTIIQNNEKIDYNEMIRNLISQIEREIYLKNDPIERVASTTEKILAKAIFKAGLKKNIFTANPIQLESGINKAVAVVTAELKKMATPIPGKKELAQVCNIAAGYDEEIGCIIVDAREKIGRDGVITIFESKGTNITLEIIGGFQFNGGYASPYFITDNDTMKVMFDEPYILLYNNTINSIDELHFILEKMIQIKGCLLIIVEDIFNDALEALVSYVKTNKYKIAVVKVPGTGEGKIEILEDICALTGGKIISYNRDDKRKELQINDLGRAKKVIIDKACTIIEEGKGSKELMKNRISYYKSKIKNTDSEYYRNELQNKMARMVGAIAIINVGARTDNEIKEKIIKLENADNAAKAAIEEGIVPGNGLALLRTESVFKNLKFDGDEQIGIDIIKSAIIEPVKQIIESSGVDTTHVLQKLRENKGAYGFNVKNKEYEDFLRVGIIEPTSVPIVALKNAAKIGWEYLLLIRSRKDINFTEIESKLLD